MGFFSFAKKKKKDNNDGDVNQNDGDVNNQAAVEELQVVMEQEPIEAEPQDNNESEAKEEEPQQDNNEKENQETKEEDEQEEEEETKTEKNSNKKKEKKDKKKDDSSDKENRSIPGEVNFVELKVFKVTHTFETASTHSVSIDNDQLELDAMTKQRADSPHFQMTQQLSELFMVEMQKASVEDVTRAMCTLASLFLPSSRTAATNQTPAGLDLKPQDYAKESLILGGHTVVFLGMKRYPRHEQLQRAGCSCILLLAKHIRNTIVAAGGMEVVVQALKLHPNSKLVQRSACAALSGCYHKFQKAPLSVAKKLHRFVSEEEGLQLVVSAMNRFPVEADLQDIGCRFLCNLSKSHVFCDVLRKTRAMSAVTRANEKHPQNEAILLCAQKLTAAVLA